MQTVTESRQLTEGQVGVGAPRRRLGTAFHEPLWPEDLHKPSEARVQFLELWTDQLLVAPWCIDSGGAPDVNAQFRQQRTEAAAAEVCLHLKTMFEIMRPNAGLHCCCVGCTRWYG